MATINGKQAHQTNWYIYKHKRGFSCQTVTRVHKDVVRAPENRSTYFIRGFILMICPDCGSGKQGHGVFGVVNDRIPCNGKCMGATGPSCECQCGGENHGSNF